LTIFCGIAIAIPDEFSQDYCRENNLLQPVPSVHDYFKSDLLKQIDDYHEAQDPAEELIAGHVSKHNMPKGVADAIRFVECQKDETGSGALKVLLEFRAVSLIRGAPENLFEMKETDADIQAIAESCAILDIRGCDTLNTTWKSWIPRLKTNTPDLTRLKNFLLSRGYFVAMTYEHDMSLPQSIDKEEGKFVNVRKAVDVLRKGFDELLAANRKFMEGGRILTSEQVKLAAANVKTEILILRERFRRFKTIKRPSFEKRGVPGKTVENLLTQLINYVVENPKTNYATSRSKSPFEYSIRWQRPSIATLRPRREDDPAGSPETVDEFTALSVAYETELAESIKQRISSKGPLPGNHAKILQPGEYNFTKQETISNEWRFARHWSWRIVEEATLKRQLTTTIVKNTTLVKPPRKASEVRVIDIMEHILLAVTRDGIPPVCFEKLISGNGEQLETDNEELMRRLKDYAKRLTAWRSARLSYSEDFVKKSFIEDLKTIVEIFVEESTGITREMATEFGFNTPEFAVDKNNDKDRPKFAAATMIWSKFGDLDLCLDANGEVCSICMSTIEGNLERTSCGHCFHIGCLHGWKSRAISVPTCPICRTALPNKSVVDAIASDDADLQAFVMLAGKCSYAVQEFPPLY
jgi:hypothetical protein